FRATTTGASHRLPDRRPPRNRRRPQGRPRRFRRRGDPGVRAGGGRRARARGDREARAVHGRRRAPHPRPPPPPPPTPPPPAAPGAGEGDVGPAGLKDREAIARQQISLPPPVTPEAVLALALPGMRAVTAARHPHKLKTGHLAGNRFVVVVRGLAIPVDEAVA